MDRELCLVGGEAKGQLGVGPNREGLVKLGGEGVEVGGKGRGKSGRVGDEEGDRSPVVDLGGERDWEGAVSIS